MAITIGNKKTEALIRELGRRRGKARARRCGGGAAERFGRGTGHPTRLNFGDCLSYAVAKHLDATLLFKGDDFLQTDIRSAVAA